MSSSDDPVAPSAARKNARMTAFNQTEKRLPPIEHRPIAPRRKIPGSSKGGKGQDGCLKHLRAARPAKCEMRAVSQNAGCFESIQVSDYGTRTGWNLCIHTMFSMYTYEHSYEYESILIL